jgi:hypothetical protein
MTLQDALVAFKTYARAADNDFRDYYLRQLARSKPKLKAMVSTMGKLAELIYYCLSNGKYYEYQGKYRFSPEILSHSDSLGNHAERVVGVTQTQ